jgi:type IV pilus biogenesis protein PilP
MALPALEFGADQSPDVPESPPPFLPKDTQPEALPPKPAGLAPPPDGALIISQQTPIAPIGHPQDLMPSLSADAAFLTPSPPKAEPFLAQDQTLADKRPRPRPDDLMPVVAVAAATEPLAPDSRYASLRPQARPADLNPASAALAQGLVLASSPKPQARPADINTGNDDTVAVAMNQAPKDQAEAPAPSLPSNASVAKQATEKMALSANRVALLGVFGTATRRYAMIRLAGGRVKKVEVGDMIDGGRIAGITADTVQYQKGSRIVTLSLPQG